MGDIVLSAGVRQNLLSLQNTAELMAITQNRLATGKKVNSALDNPSSFFTSQSLSNRANDLNTLLDAIGQAQQTLKAADQGLTALSNLINSAKSIAKQAQQSPPATATYSLAITGNTAIVDDTTRIGSASTFASQVANFIGSAKSTYTIDATSFAGATDGNTLTLSNGTQTITLEYDGGANGVASGNVGFTDDVSLKAALQSVFGAANVTGTTTLTVTGADYTTSFANATGDAALTGLVSRTPATDGSKLTVTQGATTVTLRYVASGADPAGAGTFTSLSDLVTAVNSSGIGSASVDASVHASNDGSGRLRLESTTGFTIGGSVGNLLGFGAGATTYNTTNAAYNATLASLTGVLSIAVGSGAAQTIDVATQNTKASFTAALAGLSGVTATINGLGQISITSTSPNNVTIGGTGTSATGLFAAGNVGVNAPTVTAGTNSTVRAGLQAQFNSLLVQIDQLAGDASYNGINLLNGDDLKVVFNESGTSSLTIAGVTFNSGGLGLAVLNSSEFQDNAQIDTVVTAIDAALTKLRSQASDFGSTLTTVEARQNFTKNLITTLQIGSDNLVLADTNEEGANLLALQTRQQLSTTALSLSAQADQAVLRLFGG